MTDGIRTRFGVILAIYIVPQHTAARATARLDRRRRRANPGVPEQTARRRHELCVVASARGRLRQARSGVVLLGVDRAESLPTDDATNVANHGAIPAQVNLESRD